MRAYYHHIGDFNQATRHLDRTERSIYRDLIELYYDKERPLCNNADDLARKILARGEEVKVQLVLEEFFKLDQQADPPVWRHARCDAEIEKYQSKASSARRANEARWASDDRSDDRSDVASDNSSDYESQPVTSISNHKPDNKHPFDEFWAVYPRKDNKKRAESAWRRLSKKKQEIAMRDCQTRYVNTERQFIPHASTYLNQERWEDEISQADRKPKLFLPRVDEQLARFAETHGLPAPNSGETYPQYRGRLMSAIEARANE